MLNPLKKPKKTPCLTCNESTSPFLEAPCCYIKIIMKPLCHSDTNLLYEMKNHKFRLAFSFSGSVSADHT